MAEAEASGFAQAVFELADAADLATQADFARKDRERGKGATEVCGGDGGENGEVSGGLDDLEAAGRLREDILIGEAEVGVFLENGDEQSEAAGIEAGDFAFGGAEDSGGGEGLDFHVKAAGALHHGADGGAGTLLEGLLGQNAAAVVDGSQA